MNAIKTASDLKRAVNRSGNEPHFFTRSTMKFFGDTMRNYGVRGPMEIETVLEEKATVYALIRRKPVKNGLDATAYFDATTFRRRFKA